jgi:hypothetical protein
MVARPGGSLVFGLYNISRGRALVFVSALFR